jgi:hypothetical protein
MTTYTYVTSTNTLKQVPTMEKPVYHGPTDFVSIDHLAEIEKYNAHLANPQ